MLYGNGQLAHLQFLALDYDGSTGLTGLLVGDFTFTLYEETSLAAVPVTVTELGDGYYSANFTPNVIGTWLFTAVTPTGDILQHHFQVGEYSVLEAIAVLQKLAVNRLEVDFTTQELVLYQDDGTTVRQRWDLDTNAGELVSTQTGVQTKRSGPKL